MKRTYYENPGDQQWMLGITETQNQMTVQENIEVQDPAEPESMMSLSLESKTSAIHEVAERLDKVDINIDENLDGLMENLEHTIQEEIPE